MAQYVKATNFASKDALLSGDPNKIVKGAEIDDEFSAIQTAVNSKADTLSPTLTGTPLAPTATAGTVSTQIATTAFVNTAVTNGITNERTATATLTNKTVTGTFTGPLTGNVTGNVTGDVTGNSGTATKLATARTIGGVSFDGTANINLPGVNTTGNQSTTGNAATATTATSAGQVSSGLWQIYVSGAYVYFMYNGNNVLRLDSSGNLVAEGNITAYGSV